MNDLDRRRALALIVLAALFTTAGGRTDDRTIRIEVAQR